MKLTEIVKITNGTAILADGERVKVNHVCSRDIVYNIKAHYKDAVPWEKGEREKLEGAPEHLMKEDDIQADFFHFGPRSVYIEGVTITTIGGNWFDQTSDDGDFRTCRGECQGHDYLRTVEFYKKS